MKGESWERARAVESLQRVTPFQSWRVCEADRRLTGRFKTIAEADTSQARFACAGIQLNVRARRPE